jgi:hypothetical protein
MCSVYISKCRAGPSIRERGPAVPLLKDVKRLATLMVGQYICLAQWIGY